MHDALSIHQLKQQLTTREFAEWLIQKGPCFWWAKGNFWVITDYEIAKKLLTGNDLSCNRAPFFLSRMPDINLSLLTDFFTCVSKMMVMKDDNDHQRSRRICYYGFTNTHINRLIPNIKQLVDSLIIPLKKGMCIDFVSHFAEKIPMQTLADFFNIPKFFRQPKRLIDRGIFYL